MEKPWFGAKTYGFGISPKSPAGWMSLVVYIVCLVASMTVGHRLNAPPWVLGLIVLVLTIALLALAVVKGDHQPSRWRWGGR